MTHDKSSDFTLAEIMEEIRSIHRKVDEILAVTHSAYHENLSYLRDARANSSTYVGDFKALTIIENGYKMYVDTRSRDHGVHLMYGGKWEEAYTLAFLRLLRSGSTVLDVGANLGWYSMIAAPIVGRTGSIVAIEPNKRFADLLFASFEINGFENFCQVYNVAAGDRCGMVDLMLNVDRPGHAYAREFGTFIPVGETNGSADAYLAQSVALDDLMISRGHDFADVIKMDIEGFEGVALRGLERHLATRQDLRLIIEWNARMDESPSPKRETAEFLVKHNFLPFNISASGDFVATDWDELVSNPNLVNIVLLRDGDPLLDQSILRTEEGDVSEASTSPS